MSDPLVLIPGLQSDASAWMPVLRQLGHYHALCIPMGHQFAPDLSMMTQKVLAQSPPRFHLVGWSMGGYIALDILRRAPERIASLILISTMAGPESEAARARRGEVLEIAETRGVRPYQAENLVTCLFRPEAIEPGIIEPMLAASEILGYGAFEAQIRAIMDRPDSRPDLAASIAPLLIVVGREDTIIPVSHAREIQRLRPDAAFHEIPECGHCPPLEHPELVAGILNAWLRDFETGAGSGMRKSGGVRS